MSMSRGGYVQGIGMSGGGYVQGEYVGGGGGTWGMEYYGIRSTSERYASHWNAFLLNIHPHKYPAVAMWSSYQGNFSRPFIMLLHSSNSYGSHFSE